ncbi:MAG: 2-amino-4-hydroxy-6-hydroxymethyldihydropteridine diphosphokinase [Spirochaetae bacterium HGW-Spirochaetae-1]|jgi:2-amino-4-hydroxy-6-hydroxymethyldihydropteridine diphosphokinase|nr:MAG: 2-amino-4-hydroxy-6-hydroxymethyldihydropteridine diphosphokinase [Spirochaetae bacterium HGW-Spirochaetae-1]
MTDVYIGLGTNLGDRERNLSTALSKIREDRGMRIKVVSGVLETEPVDYTDQPFFLNQMVMVETAYEPEKLLALLKNIEQDMGRKESVPKGPRIIDLDIILYGSLVMKTGSLTIPHGEMLRRVFVMDQLLELDPGLVDPVTQKKISEVRYGTEKHK